jgi:8-oxo-dGTP diphosphatase
MQKIAIAVIRAGDHVVVGIRPKGAVLAGYHEFPGGKVQENESVSRAATRETLEETGLAVAVTGSLLEQSFEYSHGQVHLHFLTAVPNGWVGGPPLPPLRAPFRWVSSEELPNLRFPEGNQQLLELLQTQWS